MTIVGLDSSFDAPTLEAAVAARDAGVRLWSGYLGVRPHRELGLAIVWERWQFDIARLCGGTPLGFCSGWDDPAAVRQLAAAWRVRACLDVEDGIRPDGSWVQGWLDQSGAGLYGLANVHRGRRAAYHVVARYLNAGCGGASWDPAAGPRPSAPCAWQCQGTHTEFGRGVDRGIYDDWFAAGAATPQQPRPAGGRMFIPYPDGTSFGEVYADGDGRCRWGIWTGGAGQFEGFSSPLTVLGSPQDANDLVECTGVHSTYQGTLRLNIRGVRADGSRWIKVMNASSAALITDWRKSASTPDQYVPGEQGETGPADPPGPVVSDDHIASVAAAAAVAEFKRRLENG
jgi:hypothetical protein